MSIIYEALKKTQQKRDLVLDTIEGKRRFRFVSWRSVRNVMKYSLLLAIPLLLATGIYKYIVFYTASKAPANKPYMMKLTLNGVFTSPQEKIAVINNRTMHTGDSIAGLKVTSIDYSGVVLSNGASSVTLHQ